MSRFIPVDPEKWAAMVIAQSDLVRYKEICDELDAECTRLKAEVERLTAFTTRTIIPNEELQAEKARLKAEVERLRFIGDEIIMDVYRSECLTDKWCKMARKWDAAKEGKQP